jgi:ribonucleotide monophosphatase NagD (HAD superfamily)
MTDKKSIPESSAAALEAMIQYNNSGFHRHILREIRSDGAFVEMGNVRVLQQNAPVRVVFVHHDKGANYTHLINARVKRILQNGAQLIFSNLDRQAYNALQKLQAQMAVGHIGKVENGF